jgi:predicted glutamine amidotransferase
MCVIIALAPNATINKRQLFNAVYNNWHGFGLVVRDGNGRIELTKEFSVTGTDPERVWKLLEDNKDLERYLHVRHSTKGATDESNVQPFEVYNSQARRVFFMHNGTLTGFGGGWNSNTGQSDTLDFAEKILEPSLLAWNGPNGKADYTDENFQKLVVDKQWTGGSTGLFVSNDLDMYRLGAGWSLYKHPDISSEGEVWTSNNQYYDKVQRGPMFQRMEEERRAREAKEREEARSKEVSSNDVPFPPMGASLEEDGDRNGNSTPIIMGGIKTWNGSHCNKSPRVLRAIAEITNTWDMDDVEALTKLKFVAYDEWAAMVKEENPYTTAALIEHLADTIAKQALRIASLTMSKERAQKRLQQISLDKKVEDNEPESKNCAA